MRTTRLCSALSGLGLATVLAACGGATPGADGAGGTAAAVAAADISAEHNEADVTFAQGMIPHHEQAVDMSDMALAAAEDPAVLALAEEISAAQGPEIETMRGMLDAWGAEQPADHGDHAGMDMDGMAGMMSAEDMAALGDAEGPPFDEMWLTMMVEHHEGAVDMARTQLDEGANPEALALAEEIISTQEAEIALMQDLLGG
ncbi:DUF305 domain-containing protein [Aquipuribacter nitratireducens]|uniref:DUF305 domain-containing protein n=1 Tax=Aquipuribacter nitratireducens TaxID=650104 RepID=A0ABW0GQP0_9MICO